MYIVKERSNFKYRK